VRVCVCQSVRKVYYGKTAELIWMPFGMVSGVSRGIGILDGVVIVEGKGQFWGEFGASHSNQWGCSCVVVQKVREPIKLSFGEVSGIIPGIRVLDGIHMLQGEGVGGFWSHLPPLAHWFEWWIL